MSISYDLEMSEQMRIHLRLETVSRVVGARVKERMGTITDYDFTWRTDHRVAFIT